MIPLFFWPLFVALLAAGQGKLLPAIRRTPPGAEANEQAFALHGLFLAAYLLPIWLRPSIVPLLLWAAVALLVRGALFDVVLNWAAGDAILAVGQTAATDRLLRRLLPSHPELLSGLLKAACLLLAIGAVLWFR